MRSVSRRTSLNLGSPGAMRARSAERSMQQFGEGIQLDFGGENDDAQKHRETLQEDELVGNRDRTSSASSQVRSHRRAMSDPFDTADMEGITDEDLHSKERAGEIIDYGLAEEQRHALPTLARFPFEETSNMNCWSEPPPNTFSVRGPNYLKDRKKITETSFLLPARGCDLFLSDNPNACEMSCLKGALHGNLRTEPSLVIRFTFPWGILLQYYSVTEKFVPFMRAKGEEPSMDGFSPAEQALAKWLAGDADYRSDRLKLISFVPDGPWLVRNMVTGKPAIIGRKLPVEYKYSPREGAKADFLECDLDIGSSSKTAKRIVSVCRRYMSSLTVDIGFVIEGTTQEELPETMMGAIRVHQVDPIKAPTVH